MPATEMVVMVAVVAALALAFIHLVRLAGTALMHKTARRMVDIDPSSAEAMIERLGAVPERSGDDRLATILIAFGIAMIVASVIINGTALWLRLFIIERARKRAARQ